MNNQPKPDSKTYDDLISDVKKGIIKVPKFQRDFVWDLKATAALSCSFSHQGLCFINSAPRYSHVACDFRWRHAL